MASKRLQSEKIIFLLRVESKKFPSNGSTGRFQIRENLPRFLHSRILEAPERRGSIDASRAAAPGLSPALQFSPFFHNGVPGRWENPPHEEPLPLDQFALKQIPSPLCH